MRIAHTKHEGTEHNVSNGLGANYMTALYGLHSNATLEAFLASHYFSGAVVCPIVFRCLFSFTVSSSPDALLLVTELMEESLVVLASRLHWPLEDVLYLTVHDSCVDKETTQFQVYCSKDLRSAVDARQGLVDMIRSLHDRDTRLYSAVRAKLAGQFANGGHSYAEARTQLHEASAALSELCVPRRQGKFFLPSPSSLSRVKLTIAPHSQVHRAPSSSPTSRRQLSPAIRARRSLSMTTSTMSTSRNAAQSFQ